MSDAELCILLETFSHKMESLRQALLDLADEVAMQNASMRDLELQLYPTPGFPN